MDGSILDTGSECIWIDRAAATAKRTFGFIFVEVEESSLVVSRLFTCHGLRRSVNHLNLFQNHQCPLHHSRVLLQNHNLEH